MTTTTTMDHLEGQASGATAERSTRPGSRKLNAVLWVLQVLVALVFLWASWAKLSMPLDALAKVSPLPAPLLKLVAVCEAAGAAGLILPGLLGIRPGLTPLAASGLVIIMIGAVISALATMPASWAVLPLVVGVAAAFVAYGRWRLVPLRHAR
jgi:hypothetical protein